MDNQQERPFDEEFWWFIGFFDGEGWITMNLRKSRRQTYIMKPVLGLANTDSALMEKCANILTKYGIAHYFYTKYRKNFGTNNKDQKCFVIVGLKRCKRFIDLFGKYIHKQKQIEAVSKFINHRLSVGYNELHGNYELSLYHEIRKLNQRGILRDYTPSLLSLE